MNSPLIRAQTLELVLRGYLQTRGAFFTRADVRLCAVNLEQAARGSRSPADAPPGVRPVYNQLPEGY